MDNNAYTPVQKVLHWLSAVVVIWALCSGFYSALADAPAGVKSWISFFNISLTTVFIPFFAVRLFVALRHRSPLGAGEKAWQAVVATLVHRSIYLNITVVLLTGVLMMESDINVFDVVHLPQPIHDRQWTAFFNVVHIATCALLSAQVLLHVCAVIKHQLGGNPVLKRMLG